MSEQHASRMGMVNVVQKHNAGAYQLDHSFIGVIRLSENPNREELVVNSGFVDGISDTITERQHVERNLSHSRGDASSTRRSGDELHEFMRPLIVSLSGPSELRSVPLLLMNQTTSYEAYRVKCARLC
jgi:hypothetical protein